MKGLKQFLFIGVFFAPLVVWANGENGVCVHSNSTSMLESKMIQPILDVTQSSERETDSVVNQIEFCIDIVSSGINATKAVSSSTKCLVKNSGNLTKKVTSGMNATRNFAKLIKIKVPFLQIPIASLNLVQSKGLRDQLSNAAKLADATVDVVCSWVPLPSVRNATKALVTGAKLCDDVSCLLASKNTTDVVIHSAKLIGNTATLACAVASVPSIVTTSTDALATGAKAYKVAKSTYQLASDTAADLYSRGSIPSLWIDQTAGTFKMDPVNQQPEDLSIECEANGSRVWAKALPDFNSSKSEYFKASGNWANIKNEKNSEFAFVLSTAKRDVRQACLLSLYLEKKGLKAPDANWKKQAAAMFEGQKIEFRARRGKWSFSFPVAIREHLNKNNETFCKIVSS